MVHKMKNFIFVAVAVIILVAGAFYIFTGNSDKMSYDNAEEGINNSNPSLDGSGFDNNNQSKTMKIASKAFENSAYIPPQYTCDAEGGAMNPPLQISGVPEETKSLVLLMDDPDIPAAAKQSMGIDKFDHWTLYGISPDTLEIGEGASAGASGLNSAGKTGYTPPCPPDGEHRYFFKLFALDTNINFIKAPRQSDIEAAMQGHILDSAELVGLYKRE